MKKALKTILIIVVALILIVLIYLAYVLLSYYRIEDNKKLDVDNPKKAEQTVNTGKELKLSSWNIGFAAYLQDYTFFMDGGTESRARSKDAVLDSMKNITDKLQKMDSDFYFVQEVDFDSTRAYHVDERQIIRDKFKNMSYVWAQNYDSPYLAYPFSSPHGANKSSLVTLSKARITSSLRRSLPIQTDLAKVLDLDRCYSISRVPTDNGKELILINFHLSAYTTDPTISNQQLDMIYKTMKEEYEKGNYVICGGDFNKDLVLKSSEVFGVAGGEDASWCQPFPTDTLPEFVSLVQPTDLTDPYPTCRNNDMPYKAGKTFVCTVDGFLVSDNVQLVETAVEHEDFKYSDHNPIYIKFILK